MIRHLWIHRTRPPGLRGSLLAWAKRIKALPELCQFEFRKLLLRLRGARIADTAVLSSIDLKGNNLSVGEYTSIGAIYVQAFGPVNIGSHVVINDGVTLITGTHDPETEDYRFVTYPITIHDYAWIAMKATILPGVVIGEGAVVGAGSVVTKDVEPYTIVCGNPAKAVRMRPRLDYSYKPSHWFGFVSAWVGLQFDVEKVAGPDRNQPIAVVRDKS